MSGSEERGRGAQRRVKAEQLRRAQLARERRERVRRVAVVAAGLVLLGAVIAYAALRGSSDSPAAQVLPARVSGDVTRQAPAVVVPDTSGIPGVVAYAAQVPDQPVPDGALQHDHVPGPVAYSVTPPVGGPHNAVWMNCGVYTAAVPNERAVHDMEHGAVWITYRPSLPAAQVAELRDLALRQPEVPDGALGRWRYTDLSPWTDDSLPAPVVISAWGRQLQVQDANDPRLQRFVDAFRAKRGVTPEPGSACGGQPVDVGGRPTAS